MTAVDTRPAPLSMTGAAARHHALGTLWTIPGLALSDLRVNQSGLCIGYVTESDDDPTEPLLVACRVLERPAVGTPPEARFAHPQVTVTGEYRGVPVQIRAAYPDAIAAERGMATLDEELADLSPAAVAEPSACGRCGVPRLEHVTQWSPSLGLHTWVRPSSRQIRRRMAARAAARKAGA